LHTIVRQAGIELAFARLPWDPRSEFDRHHLTETIEAGRIFNRFHDALAAFEEQAKALEWEICEPVSDSGVENSVRKVDWQERDGTQYPFALRGGVLIPDGWHCNMAPWEDLLGFGGRYPGVDNNRGQR
jgi:hypothetical protein